MTENKRFMIDDAGTLIDMRTRETYDYVSDVCLVLNEFCEENQSLKKQNKRLHNDLHKINRIARGY